MRLRAHELAGCVASLLGAPVRPVVQASASGFRLTSAGRLRAADFVSYDCGIPHFNKPKAGLHAAPILVLTACVRVPTLDKEGQGRRTLSLQMSARSGPRGLPSARIGLRCDLKYLPPLRSSEDVAGRIENQITGGVATVAAPVKMWRTFSFHPPPDAGKSSQGGRGCAVE